MGPDCQKAVFQSTCLDVIYDLIHNLGEFWVPALHFPETRPPLSAENSILVKLRQFPQHSMLKSDPVLIGLILTVILWKSLSPKRSSLPGTVQLGELRLSTVQSVTYAACEMCSSRVKCDRRRQYIWTCEVIK